MASAAMRRRSVWSTASSLIAKSPARSVIKGATAPDPQTFVISFVGTTPLAASAMFDPYPRHILGDIFAAADWERVVGLSLDVSVFATNVTNKTYRIANEDLYSTIGTSVTVYGEPRMFGASARYRF